MNAIDRLCTIATDVSLEATTLAADVRDELANMRSAIRKALPLLVRRSDVECEGGDWCSVHDDFMHDLDRCFTGEGVDLLRTALNSSAPQVVPLPGECPAVPAAGEALAPELLRGGGSGAGGPHLFVPADDDGEPS